MSARVRSKGRPALTLRRGSPTKSLEKSRGVHSGSNPERGALVGTRIRKFDKTKGYGFISGTTPPTLERTCHSAAWSGCLSSLATILEFLDDLLPGGKHRNLACSGAK